MTRHILGRWFVGQSDEDCCWCYRRAVATGRYACRCTRSTVATAPARRLCAEHARLVDGKHCRTCGCLIARIDWDTPATDAGGHDDPFDADDESEGLVDGSAESISTPPRAITSAGVTWTRQVAGWVRGNARRRLYGPPLVVTAP